MCLRNVRIIARFEIVRKMRTKIFYIFLFMFPLITGLLSIVPAMVAGEKGGTVFQSYAFQAVFFPSVTAVLLLFMLILFSGGEFVRSILEEKSSRIMEVLLSSCTADELLLGKVFGLAFTGLLQILIWGVFAWMLTASGMLPSAVFSNTLLSAVFFILGYLFYTSIFIGAGAVVNTEQEAQNFSNTLSTIMVLPMIIALRVVENPDLPVFRFLSLFPLTSAPVMLIRIKAHTPPLWEVLTSVLILIISIYFVVHLASRLFSAGILLTGSAPGFSAFFTRLSRR